MATEPKGFFYFRVYSSFPEHSTLGDAKSNISVRVRLGFSFGFFFIVRLRSSYCLYSETIT